MESAAPSADRPDPLLAVDPYPRRRLIALLFLPVLTLPAGAIGAALSPKLLVSWPELLIALDPRPANLVLAASSMPLWVYYLIGTVRWFVPDPFLWVLGRERGPQAIAWTEQRFGNFGKTMVDWVMRAFDRAAFWVVFFAPGPFICLIAGARGMKLAPFLVANLAGTVTLLSLFMYFGDLFSGPIARLTAFVAEHVAELTIVTSVLVALSLANRYRKRRREQRAAAAQGEVV